MLYNTPRKGLLAFIFVVDEKKNFNDNNPWWKPAMFFYAKVTGWIVAPLMVVFFFGNRLAETLGTQVIFFVLMVVAFSITCVGIYKEIKKYQKEVGVDERDSSDKNNK